MAKMCLFFNVYASILSPIHITAPMLLSLTVAPSTRAPPTQFDCIGIAKNGGIREQEVSWWIHIMFLSFVLKISHRSPLLQSTQQNLHPPEPPPRLTIILNYQGMQQEWTKQVNEWLIVMFFLSCMMLLTNVCTTHAPLLLSARQQLRRTTEAGHRESRDMLACLIICN